jgi:hypothetical protein
MALSASLKLLRMQEQPLGHRQERGAFVADQVLDQLALGSQALPAVPHLA